MRGESNHMYGKATQEIFVTHKDHDFTWPVHMGGESVEKQLKVKKLY